MLYVVSAYLLWGLFPAYFPLLAAASPYEIIAHRIVWTAVIMLVIISLTGTARRLREIDRTTWGWLSFASIAIALNWLIYVIAVNSGHVADAALGYFINPLVNVLFGIIFLKERLRFLETISIGIAVLAVVFLTVLAGEPPIIALSLAFSFGTYGLIKKKINLPASLTLTAETLVLTPCALAAIGYLEYSGQGSFASVGPHHSALLIATGVITAVPLLLFGKGARMIPLSTVGMLQYMTPTMQLLWAVFVVNESVDSWKWMGFILIWIAVAIYMSDTLIRATRSHRSHRSHRTNRRRVER
ncbi:EamA family transporter RarD [Corynebacterium sp. ES2794-CONJ1]|uniref:EamA family transporter RarD n=1 Tax=unclassified Corynebacterium TaxID=2624378 RepID=UPI002169418C|nr:MULTISPECIES: EamA family transporter RarD [unclassified Corynebacterium]MCS4489033.1 EamA family transporter RarD [Corynebacterium sp. ES2775-CONJ]MCS4490846.1 EamA family transporter RarD [Corynebacterium sp. ES2715-CONJ3]MCS4531271.1 EamA family transporter RarD [Corynebacterium sp. ES2730-CONJ]MCU9518640.1 EamA family transporter RarD [Corynebacterium sp. ES2794-CONJ1]